MSNQEEKMNHINILIMSILAAVLITSCASVREDTVKVRTNTFYDKNGEIQSLNLHVQPDYDVNDPQLHVTFDQIVRYTEYDTDVFRTRKLKKKGLDLANALAIPGDIMIDIITLGSDRATKGTIDRANYERKL